MATANDETDADETDADETDVEKIRADAEKDLVSVDKALDAMIDGVAVVMRDQDTDKLTTVLGIISGSKVVSRTQLDILFAAAVVRMAERRNAKLETLRLAGLLD